MDWVPTDWRVRSARTIGFVASGTVCTIGGGVAAAVTGPTDWDHGSWVAAYLVLVGGVAQAALGAGQALLAHRQPTVRLVRAQLAGWNLGNLAVVAGTLIDSPLLTSLGGIPLVVALALFVHGTTAPSTTMTSANGATRTRGRASAEAGAIGSEIDPTPRSVRGAFVALVLVLLVSIPIGLGLSWARA